MANTLDNAGLRELHDDLIDYVPADANIAEGLVCVFDNTSGDNRSVVLPNHANALSGGRAFAGIVCSAGSINLSTAPYDNRVPLQRRGIAKCALKDSTACVRGGIAAYDPTDSGKVVPYTSANQYPIGRFQQTLSSGTSQMVGVALDQVGSGIGSQLIGAITTTSTAVGDDAETLLDQTVTIKANRLQVGDVVKISGKCRASVGADSETLVLKVYWGGLAGLALATSTATDVAANDIYIFNITCTVRSATTIDLFGWHTPVPAAPGTADLKGLGAAGVQTIPTITAAAVIGVSSNWSAASDDRVVLESLVVEVSSQAA